MKKITAICISNLDGGAEYVFKNTIEIYKNQLECILVSDCIKIKKSKNTHLVKSLKKITENIFSVIQIFNISLNYRKSEKADYYYCNNIESIIAAIFLNLLNLRRTKIIWHCHDIYNFDKQTTKLFLKFILSNVFKCIVLTKENQKRFLNFHSNVIVINNYSDLRPKNRKKIFDPTNVTFGFIGQITPWKGVHIILDYFYKLRNKKYSKKLLIAGLPNSKKDNLYQDSLKQKFTENIYWLGFTERNDFFRKIDILLVSSTNEPFGLVLIEALKYGVPIISSPGDGPREIINTNGEVINNFKEFENNVSKIIQNYNMYSGNSLKSSSKFSKEEYIIKMNEIFK